MEVGRASGFLRLTDPKHNEAGILSVDITVPDVFSPCQYRHKTAHKVLQRFLTLPPKLLYLSLSPQLDKILIEVVYALSL